MKHQQKERKKEKTETNIFLFKSRPKTKKIFKGQHRMTNARPHAHPRACTATPDGEETERNKKCLFFKVSFAFLFCSPSIFNQPSCDCCVGLGISTG